MASHVVCAVILWCAAGAASAAEVKIWRIPADERARLRLDPEARAARSAAERQRSGAAPRGTSHDFIDGSENPELFFPTELFRAFVNSAFVALPRVYPQVIRDRSSNLFHEQGEFEFLRSVTTEFAQLLSRERELMRQWVRSPAADRAKIERELRDVRAEQCPAMAAALRSLREKFGRDRFDRTLYEVVPIGYGLSVGGGEEGIEKHVRELVGQEENCQ